jgi:hypothetical protein
MHCKCWWFSSSYVWFYFNWYAPRLYALNKYSFGYSFCLGLVILLGCGAHFTEYKVRVASHFAVTALYYSWIVIYIIFIKWRMEENIHQINSIILKKIEFRPIYLKNKYKICGFFFEFDQKMITKSNILSRNRVPYISNRFEWNLQKKIYKKSNSNKNAHSEYSLENHIYKKREEEVRARKKAGLVPLTTKFE